MEFPISVGGTVELWGRDLAGRGRLFFDGAPLTKPLLLVLNDFALLLVLDLSKAISLSRWSFRYCKSRTCMRRDLFCI